MAAVCTSGSQALSAAEGLSCGIVVSGYRFEDMLYEEVRQYLPGTFDMLLISSPGRWDGHSVDHVICLPMPLRVHDLLNTLEMMAQAQMRVRKRQGRQRGRSQEEQELIVKAKALLMERNSMTESEAHRYIQKCSMDSGTNLVETAQMVISLIHV